MRFLVALAVAALFGVSACGGDSGSGESAVQTQTPPKADCAIISSDDWAFKACGEYLEGYCAQFGDDQSEATRRGCPTNDSVEGGRFAEALTACGEFTDSPDHLSERDARRLNKRLVQCVRQNTDR